MSALALLRRLVVLATLLLWTATPAFAAPPRIADTVGQPTPAAPKTLGVEQVREAALSYAKTRGFRPGAIGVDIVGLTESGKSTRAVLHIGEREVKVAINHGTMRLQSRETSAVIDALLAAHVPYKRADTGDGSRFATMVVDFQPGEGARLGARVQQPAVTAPMAPTAPLGRPRAGAPAASLAFDALSLGQGGHATVALGSAVVAGRPGAGIVVRENGIADAKGNVINQTPGLVEVMVDGAWHRLGYAGYKAAGDTLLFENAIDPIPAGSSVSVVRVSDDASAPHPRGSDPTDNAVAAARGVGGFDLVSVEGLEGEYRRPLK